MCQNLRDIVSIVPYTAVKSTHNSIIPQETDSQLRNLVSAFRCSDGAEHAALFDERSPVR